jgi:hypothetical protein
MVLFLQLEFQNWAQWHPYLEKLGVAKTAVDQYMIDLIEEWESLC